MNQLDMEQLDRNELEFETNKLSVVIPSYNEELNIVNTSRVVSNVLEQNKIEYEIIFVDDGSKDKTWDKIKDVSSENENVKGVQFSRNFGKEACIFAGLSHAKGQCCVVIDCDLQHPPEMIPQMYELWTQGYQVIEGVKKNRGKESFFHKMFAGLFYKIISKCTNIDMEASSDFKLLDRQVVNTLLSLKERNTFFRALSFWVGYRSVIVEFEVAEREFGVSKWSFKSLVKYAINNVTAFSAAPLTIIPVMGVIFLICSLFLMIQTLVKWGMGHAVEGFTTVIILLLIIGGVLMISLGVIGYYIAKIYDEIKERPRYIVSEVVQSEVQKNK